MKPSLTTDWATWAAAIATCGVTVFAVHYLHFYADAGNPAESAPPVIAVLIVSPLAVAAALLRHRTTLFATKNLYIFFIATSVAALVAGNGFFQRFIVLTTILFYKATDANRMTAYQEPVPAWFAPKDRDVITDMYEGGAAGVPWSAWIVPIVFWTCFMTAFFILQLSMMSMLRKQWVERERLAFPQAVLPAQLALGLGGRSLFSSPLFWGGFTMAFVYHLLCGVNHYLDLVHWGHTIQPFEGVHMRPWRQLHVHPSFGIRISWTVLGIGYLINQEISFSIWAFIVLIKIAQICADAAGFTATGFPTMPGQAIGAFFFLGALGVWAARRHISEVWKRGIGLIREPIDAGEPISHRTTVLAFSGSFCWVCAALMVSGLPLGLVLGVVGYLLMMGVSYARIRVESGAPIIWCLPFAGITFLGTVTAFTGARYAQAEVMIVLAMLGIMTIGFFPALMANQIEAMKLADLVNLPRRAVPTALIVGCVAGLLSSFLIVLPMFYRSGANVIARFETEVLWHPVRSVNDVINEPKISPHAYANAGLGGLVVLGLAAARHVCLWFPLHPVGYVIALTHGGGLMFGCIFIAWMIKALVLSYGGVRLFRLLAPFFIGLPFGEFAGFGFWYLLAPLFHGGAYPSVWG